jgi:putative glutamine amidotransferase
VSQSPRIAILAQDNYWTRPVHLFGNSGSHRSIPYIIEAIERAGGQAEMVSPSQQEASVSSFDGLVIPGGVDIHPAYYGQTVGQGMDADSLDPMLDAFQISWAKKALRSNLPMLGICRGMQVMNVAAGGTLVQDLESAGAYLDHLPGRVLSHSVLRQETVHAIRTAPGSNLSQLIGRDAVQVNSIHHQAVATLGKHLQVTAWAEDGTAEAIEHQGRSHQLGVQFHPEDLTAHRRFQNLFDHLVESTNS